MDHLDIDESPLRVLRVRFEIAKSRSCHWARFVDEVKGHPSYKVRPARGKNPETHVLTLTLPADIRDTWQSVCCWRGVRIFLDNKEFDRDEFGTLLHQREGDLFLDRTVNMCDDAEANVRRRGGRWKTTKAEREQHRITMEWLRKQMPKMIPYVPPPQRPPHPYKRRQHRPEDPGP
ncbi:MAG: hypothetical protein NTY77_05420 [Elusimicrobia bacterium]|nr:hypothetical protein [Elusimicrobiota bacterium]